LKKKANYKANITWDDDSESSKSEEEQEDNKKYIAFGASLQSHLSEESSDDSDDEEEGDEFEDNQELREKYDQLYRESVKITKVNLKLAEKYKSVVAELAKLKNRVDNPKGVLASVKRERDMLQKEVVGLKEKINVLTDQNSLLEIELASANSVFERFNAGSKALDDMLLMQRPSSDKSGLGYLGESTSMQNGGKINETKPNKVNSKPHAIPIVHNNAKTTHDIKKTNKKKFIPTCHYCHVKGHIKQNCFKLHGYPITNHVHAPQNIDNYVQVSNMKPRPLRGKLQMSNISHTHLASSHSYDKHVPTCHFCGVKGHIRPNCFKLHGYPNSSSQYQYVNDYHGRSQRSRRKVTYGHYEKVNPIHVPKNGKEIENVKTRSIWVRRSNLRPHADLSADALDDSGSSRGVDLAF